MTLQSNFIQILNKFGFSIWSCCLSSFFFKSDLEFRLQFVKCRIKKLSKASKKVWKIIQTTQEHGMIYRLKWILSNILWSIFFGEITENWDSFVVEMLRNWWWNRLAFEGKSNSFAIVMLWSTRKQSMWDNE